MCLFAQSIDHQCNLNREVPPHYDTVLESSGLIQIADKSILFSYPYNAIETGGGVDLSANVSGMDPRFRDGNSWKWGLLTTSATCPPGN